MTEFVPDAVQPSSSLAFVPDNPMPPERPGLAHGIATAADIGTAALANTIEAPVLGAVGLAERAIGHSDTPVKNWLGEHMVYHTQEDLGRPWVNAMEKPIAGALHSVDKAVGDYAGSSVQKWLREIAGTASDAANVLPAAGAISREVSAATAAKPLMDVPDVARAPDELARAAGIKVRPSDVQAATGSEQPSIAARATESVGGSKDLKREFILENKPKINALASASVQMPEGTLLSPASLAEAEKPYAVAYDAVKKRVGPTEADPQFLSAVQQAGVRKDSVLPISGEIRAAQQSLVDAGEMNGKQIIATMSDLRERGFANKLSDNSNTQALGKAQLDLARALEDRLERATAANAPDLLPAFKEARIGFAKTGTIRASLVGHDINPQAVLRLADNNPGITGELKLIADLAERFPKVVTHKVPEPSGGALHAIKTYGSLGVVPAAQKIARMFVSGTRGEAETADVSLGSALADYTTSKASAGFHPSQEPPAPLDPLTRAMMEQDATGRVQKGDLRARLMLPSPETVSRGADMAAGNETLNAADMQTLADAITSHHPSSARPAPLRLPAPGQLAPRDVLVGELTRKERQAALQHPGSGNNPAPSTLTAARQRAIMNHLIQVLAARENP